MVHCGDDVVSSQGIIDTSLCHRRFPEVKQEIAVLARIPDGSAERRLLQKGYNMRSRCFFDYAYALSFTTGAKICSLGRQL